MSRVIMGDPETEATGDAKTVPPVTPSKSNASQNSKSFVASGSPAVTRHVSKLNRLITENDIDGVNER